jgi:cytochrome c oxidase subunit IV
MTEAGHKEPNYMGVFWALLVLTLAEVGIFYLRPPHLVLVISLVLMALVKAGLVAAYFMHLRFEAKTLAIIVISPLGLSALMLIGLTPDAHYGPPRKPPTQWTLPGHEGVQQGTPEGAAPGQENAAPATAPEGQTPPAPEKKPEIPPNQADGPA